ncbi:MAG: tRNA (adenosine(37)-N6)-dimethylallyltransferase MiaA [Vulcanimicrobiaceae bacterium]
MATTSGRVGESGVLLLAGPTAAGKSTLALALAARYDAEIVGADSRQIYRGMEIGTAAASAAERARIPHHLVGFLDPRERYSAAQFVADALAAIAAIRARGRRVLVVGGTGFYLRALAGDVALSPARDPALRARLAREARLHPPEILHAWLASRAPERARELAPGDRYRVARALEIALAPASPAEAAPSLRSRGISFAKTYLECASEELDRRIEARVARQLAAGFAEEAERIGPQAVAADAVGYPLAFAYLAGALDRADFARLLVRATRRYAKRQRTWFAKEPGLVRLPAERFEGFVRERLGW